MLIWIVAIIINIHLHKASIFFHSHIGKTIENLKNIPLDTFRTDNLKRCDQYAINRELTLEIMQLITIF